MGTMKRFLITLLTAVVLIAGGCSSGQDSPTDSHPGSGSVKEDAESKDSKATDTSRKDSAQQKYQ